MQAQYIATPSTTPLGRKGFLTDLALTPYPPRKTLVHLTGVGGKERPDHRPSCIPLLVMNGEGTEGLVSQQNARCRG
jgi:hypothetical protein